MTSKRPTRHKHTRLETFAAAHRLKVEIDMITDSGTAGDIEAPVIRFNDRATISELESDVIETVGRASDNRQRFKPREGEKRLCFAIRRGHLNYLYNTIGFAIPREPKELKLNAWAKCLQRVGIQTLGGGEGGIVFTFPTDNPEAVQTVFALAAKKVMLRGLGLRG